MTRATKLSWFQLFGNRGARVDNPSLSGEATSWCLGAQCLSTAATYSLHSAALAPTGSDALHGGRVKSKGRDYLRRRHTVVVLGARQLFNPPRPESFMIDVKTSGKIEVSSLVTDLLELRGQVVAVQRWSCRTCCADGPEATPRTADDVITTSKTGYKAAPNAL